MAYSRLSSEEERCVFYIVDTYRLQTVAVYMYMYVLGTITLFFCFHHFLTNVNENTHTSQRGVLLSKLYWVVFPFGHHSLNDDQYVDYIYYFNADIWVFEIYNDYCDNIASCLDQQTEVLFKQ